MSGTRSAPYTKQETMSETQCVFWVRDEVRHDVRHEAKDDVRHEAKDDAGHDAKDAVKDELDLSLSLMIR